MAEEEKSLSNLNRSGRAKGSKNKTTLFKEAMRDGFEQKLMTDGQKVFDAVVAKALEGDMSAAKMIMDRIVPVTQSDKGLKRIGEGGLTIHIERLEASTGVIDEPIEIVEAEYEEVK